MPHGKRQITWQEISKACGLTIVGVVMVAWLALGKSISEPGPLALLGISAGLLSLNAADAVKRAIRGTDRKTDE